MGGNDLFKVKIEEAKQYMYLTLYVDWQFITNGFDCVANKWKSLKCP